MYNILYVNDSHVCIVVSSILLNGSNDLIDTTSDVLKMINGIAYQNVTTKNIYQYEHENYYKSTKQTEYCWVYE